MLPGGDRGLRQQPLEAQYYQPGERRLDGSEGKGGEGKYGQLRADGRMMQGTAHRPEEIQPAQLMVRGAAVGVALRQHEERPYKVAQRQERGEIGGYRQRRNMPDRVLAEFPADPGSEGESEAEGRSQHRHAAGA